MKKLKLHWKILIGMVIGVLFGFIMLQFTDGKSFVQNWIEPVGVIFVRMLKLIAVPLIVASLIKGIIDLKDISKFKSMGIKTIFLYVSTTIIAITIGLTIVNIVKPGEGISEETIIQLKETYASNDKIQERISEAGNQQSKGPLQFVVDMVPDNAVKAMGDNKSMLQVIFFSIFLGICMLLVPAKRAEPLKNFFDALNAVVLKMVDIIMLFAPVAVMALLATVIVTANDADVLLALLRYAGVVIGGLLLMVVFYLIVVSLYTKKSPFWFLQQMAPAQLLAFSTSSSAATLPVTMERVEEHIGVDKEVSSFVLPVGATINMDGT
ncbi:MAG: dicarboxylate/amino acid:cation symporter, partial [Bacteroidia bacterium]|nr:dicarboxylate/amino acid:cation symporter [Bacteroidia bacterium]